MIIRLERDSEPGYAGLFFAYAMVLSYAGRGCPGLLWRFQKMDDEKMVPSYVRGTESERGGTEYLDGEDRSRDYLALIGIMGGSSWAYGETPREAARLAVGIYLRDWGNSYNVWEKPVAVNILHVPDINGWHWDHRGVEVETAPDQWEKRECCQILRGPVPAMPKRRKSRGVLQPVSPSKCEEVAVYVADRLEEWEPPFND